MRTGTSSPAFHTIIPVGLVSVRILVKRRCAQGLLASGRDSGAGKQLFRRFIGLANNQKRSYNTTKKGMPLRERHPLKVRSPSGDECDWVRWLFLYFMPVHIHRHITAHRCASWVFGTKEILAEVQLFVNHIAIRVYTHLVRTEACSSDEVCVFSMCIDFQRVCCYMSFRQTHFTISSFHFGFRCHR